MKGFSFMLDFFKKEKSKSIKTAAIIVAAGQSSRMNYENKQFIDILGKPVLTYSLEAFQISPSIDEIYVVAREQDILFISDIINTYGITKAVSIVAGGETRTESVKCGIDAVTDCDFFAIHDGARPCIQPKHIELTVSAAHACGASVLGCRAFDTLKTVDSNSFITGTIDRNAIWHAQTPQVFRGDIIRAAYEYLLNNNIEATDDCSLVEKTGIKIRMVEGDSSNIKITRHCDIGIAEGIIREREENFE
jgi:2-C-methyl-D-erythritol 4-phosphate cytidylyltransferase